MAAVGEDSSGFREKALPVGEMFDDFEGGDEIERAVAEGQRRAVRLSEQGLAGGVFALGPVKRFVRLVDAARGFGALGEQRRAVTGAATRIEDTAAASQRFGEAIAGQVLVEEVGVGFPRDDAFACKLHHSAGLRAMIA